MDKQNMTTRSKLEISTAILFMISMLIWTSAPCEGIGCHLERLNYWLMVWWSGAGVIVLYMLWKHHQ
jgi:hypothetical protein